MKAFALVACALAVATIVHGCNQNEVKMFHEIYNKCAKELGVPPQAYREDTVLCEIENNKAILDNNGAIEKDKAVKYLKFLISDPEKLKLAQKLAAKCIHDAQQDTNDVKELNKQVASCTVPIIPLIDEN